MTLAKFTKALAEKNAEYKNPFGHVALFDDGTSIYYYGSVRSEPIIIKTFPTISDLENWLK